MLGRATLLSCVLATVAAATPAAHQKPDVAQGERLEQLHRLEGEAVIALADAALSGKHVPSDLSIRWRNDFLKAQRGTFVPFVVTIDSTPPLTTPSVLLYVRLAPRVTPPSSARGARPERDSRPDAPTTAEFAVEEIYPIDVRAAAGQPVTVTRGFAAAAGDYDLVIVVRERVNPAEPGLPRRTGVLTRRLLLPDFQGESLTTSSVILADRVTVLETPPREEQPEERPYLIGLSEIQPAADTLLRRDEELIVVFLIYNPFVTPERKFDIEVEYHFFTRTGDREGRDVTPPAGVVRPPARDGERYFNHTKPQRFTPAIMGPQFDPSAGHPLMAGQGVPLASFPLGEYRLAIRVTDIVTGKSLLKEVDFTIVS
jgi:hypothetical protein